MSAEAGWTFFCRGRQLITKNQEIEDITIEKFWCQIKISYDTLLVSFIDFRVKLYFRTPEGFIWFDTIRNKRENRENTGRGKSRCRYMNMNILETAVNRVSVLR